MAMTIPVLPCASIPEVLTFYKALGFEVTHEQERPNPYAATRRGDLHLHFMGIRVARGETARVARARAEIAALSLVGAEQAKIEAELAALDRLAREIAPGPRPS